MDRYNSTLTESLLMHGTFREISRMAEIEIQNFEENVGALSEIYDEMTEEYKRPLDIPNNLLAKTKKLIGTTETLKLRVEKGLNELKEKVLTDKQERVHFELDLKSTRLQADYAEFSRAFSVFLQNSKELEKRYSVVSENGDSSQYESSINSQIIQEMPETQVYDQEKFVEQRGIKARAMKEEARAINDLAENIVDKVEEQDKKIDQLNEKNEVVVKDLKEANKDLEHAANASKMDNSKVCGYVLLVVIGILVLGLVIFVVVKE